MTNVYRYKEMKEASVQEAYRHQVELLSYLHVPYYGMSCSVGDCLGELVSYAGPHYEKRSQEQKLHQKTRKSENKDSESRQKQLLITDNFYSRDYGGLATTHSLAVYAGIALDEWWQKRQKKRAERKNVEQKKAERKKAERKNAEGKNAEQRNAGGKKAENDAVKICCVDVCHDDTECSTGKRSGILSDQWWQKRNNKKAKKEEMISCHVDVCHQSTWCCTGDRTGILNDKWWQSRKDGNTKRKEEEKEVVRPQSVDGFGDGSLDYHPQQHGNKSWLNKFARSVKNLFTKSRRKFKNTMQK